MKLKKVTGKRGRPTIIELSLVDGKIIVPEGLFLAVEFTAEEQAALDCPSRVKFE